MYIFIQFQPKMLLISGPNKPEGSTGQRSVLILEGHHTVPKKLKSTLTSGFLIGHDKESKTFDRAYPNTPNSNGGKKQNRSITKILFLPAIDIEETEP